jgi:hypothetical protein
MLARSVAHAARAADPTATNGPAVNRALRNHGLSSSRGDNLRFMKPAIVRLATTLLVSGGLGLAGLGLGAGTAQAYNYGPFQWCPGQAMPNDPPRSDADLVWDMSVCHTYYFAYDVRTKAPAHYWEGPNLFPTPIPPPPPPANPPNIAQQCPGLIPFVNCLPGL